MRTQKNDTRKMAMLAMMCGIVLVMGMTGIGFIPLPLIKATTMHIPVILGAIILGPGAGAILGAAFGICSIWANTTAPTIVSFAFSPFMTTEGLVGVLKSIWIALGCRVLLGLVAGYLWIFCKKIFKQDYIALPICAAVSTVFHTVSVMGSIYLLLAQQYAQAKAVAVSAVFGLVMGTVAASGIPEAILASVLVTAIGKALLHLMDRIKKR